MAFKLNQADLEFVLRQIKIAEAHAAGAPLTQIYVNAAGDVVPAGTEGAVLAIPDPHVPFGLRTVDGTFNNIVEGRETWGAADQTMPRLFDPSYSNDADGDQFDPDGPFGPSPAVTNTDYGNIGSSVADADPRIISNLIVDMTVDNPAAVTAWFNNPLAVAAWEEAHPGMTPVAPGEVTGSNQLEITNEDLASIPNIAPDEGLSAPFNAWMTFFGQFFDHGLDLITKGGAGTVYVPLQPDDPLYVEGGHTNFMVLTRATPDGGSQTNTTTPFVDQNQTYTSHASHQVFLREYAMVNDRPVATGRLLEGDGGGLATWADVKDQARDLLGIEFSNADVLNVPLLRTDPYGEFIRDANGYPQVIIGIGADGIPNTADDLVASGTPDAPLVLSNLNGGLGPVRTDHAFLDDIAHNAVPVGTFDHDGNPGTPNIAISADTDTDTGNFIAMDARGNRVAYDDELLDRHFITGDGRGNENIGLTAVHHIFHSEHNRQIDSQKLTILNSGDLDFINEWLVDDIDAATLASLPEAALDQLAFADGLAWDGERMFQAGRFATEMQYQHLVFEEFARKVQPNIDPFVFNASTDIDPSIFAEFANTVYRFGHSMLTDNMPRIDADGNEITSDLGLIDAFLNPVEYDLDGAISHEEAAGAVVRGMTIEHGNEIDEFVVGTLRNSLLGLPLDLAAINIARGRDTGMPTLNEAREQLYAASSSSFLKPYENWVEFAANLKNPASVINFIAAYGQHSTIVAATTLADKREAAAALVFGGVDAPADRVSFLTSTGSWANQESGLNLVDLWIGGLAEKKMPFGGMLGSTFNAIFELQLENLQDGDRFYYLTRTQGQNFLVELEQNSFAKMIMANTDISDPGADGIRGTADDVVARHIGVDAFAKYDFILEVNQANQAGADPTGNDPVLEALGLGKVVRDNPNTAGPDANYIRFSGGEHIVVGGTPGDDTIITDFGDDGIWGDAGNDRIESGAGVDLVNGGAGDDIITDSGDTGDFIKGDEGNDVIANSNGLDILMGGSGKDAIFVGVDTTEVFGGEGDDFILGGDGADFLLGNEGDDWIEAGGGFDTTAGDNSELFFNSAIKGHDVMFAGNDEHDFDAESGDDIMVQGESVMRNEGMFGFDWSIFKGVQVDARADLRVPIFTTEQADILRNRFDKVEALSGWEHNDTLIGDDRVQGTPLPGDTVGTTEGIFFEDGLDQEGIDRIAGLDQLMQLANGQTHFESGNILLGGGGSDVLQGNAGDDILDGDRWLNVRISIRQGETEIATVDSMKHVFSSTEPNLPAGWAGKSLFELMVDRTINPGQLHIVREILEADPGNDIDIAVFNDVVANYTITGNADGSFGVQHVTVSDILDPTTGRPLLSDGIDTVRNVEILRFTDGDILLSPPKLYLQQLSSQFSETFVSTSYTLDDGAWNDNWVETGDDGSSTSDNGQIRINGNRLEFDGASSGPGNGAVIQRGLAGLDGAQSARISFDYGENIDAGETVLVQFSRNGTDLQTVETITSTSGTNDVLDFALTGPFTSGAFIRFTVSSMNNDNDVAWIDNLNIVATTGQAVDYETTFTEDGPDQNIASNPLIVEDDQIVSARIVLTNAQPGDSFDIPGNLPGNINSAVDNSVPGQITVNLSGNEPDLADWQAAIQAIQFRNNSENPSTVDRVIQITVNDGFLNSNVATTTVNVISVNDAPNAATDNVVTNITGQIVVPEWMMLRNDSDAEGSPLTVTGATENDAGFSIVYSPATRGVTATRTDTDNTKDFTYTVTDGALSDTADVDITWDTAGTLSGTNGADIILGDAQSSTIDGNGGNDLIIGGAGNDSIDGDTGDDEIHWNVGDGRDFVNGGANTDTIVINGSSANEAFVVYSRAAALANGIGGLNAATEIVITRNGQVITELDNIEEIFIATGDGTDSVTTLGTFNGTSLNFNTITINGGSGDDTVDVSGLQSAHRIVFRSNGGNDTVVGELRPQDVIELAPGQDIASYSLIDNGNGTQSFTNGTHSITFTGAVPPQFGGDSTPDDDAIDGAFELTPRDLQGLKNLVNGLPAFEDDDDTGNAAGVRDLEGTGNNVANPDYGSADQVFIRLTQARYGDLNDDGNNRDVNPIFKGLDPRTISNILGVQEDGLPNAGNDANTFFMAFGQYFDHGLDFLPKNSVFGVLPIGGPGSERAPGTDNPADLTRGAVHEIDENGIPQHLNKTSPFVDQNQAYGSNELVGQFLRESDGNGGVGMRLFSGAPDPSAPQFKLLPTLRELIQHHWQENTIFVDESLPGGSITFRDYYSNFPIGENATGNLFDEATGAYDPDVLAATVSNFMGSGHALLLDTNPFVSLLDHYIAGDGRANENFALTSMHTVWARNHNFHVEKLLAAGFDGSAEEVFQAAKMLNEAEYQRVVFDEFADVLLGGMRGSGSHGHDEYNPDVDARISHEFAAAVYRVGHSLIGQTMTVLDANGQPMDVQLFDAFLNPSNDADVFTGPLPTGYVPQPGYEQLGVKSILGGIVTQPAEAVDFNIVDAVRNDLVRINADLFSFNVARAWDVGLGTLNQIRMDLQASTDPYIQEAISHAGDLTPYASWTDFQTRNGLSNAVIQQFMQAYPDLVLTTGEATEFAVINPNITLHDNGDGTFTVNGIDRVDLWVGGLAESHINGGLVGQTFWIVLHEQFDRLQEGDRFYYVDRFDNFDFYEDFVDGQEFADIIARNTGLVGLPESIFEVSDEDDGVGQDDDDDDQDDDADDDDDTTGQDDDDDDVDDDDDDDTAGQDDDDDQDDDVDDDDDTTGQDDDDDDVGSNDGDSQQPPLAAQTIVGTLQGDVLLGTTADDTILGRDGDDSIMGGDGADVLRGDGGNDFLSGQGGRDVVFGGDGDDDIMGGAGADMLYGEDGNDDIFGDGGNDLIDAGKGDDTVHGGAGNDIVMASSGDGNDTYYGDEAGNGEPGNDTLDMSSILSNAAVDLGSGFMGRGSAVSAETGSDTIWGFENVVTGSGNDTITASNAVNVMDGGEGNDTFRFLSAAAADGDTIVGFQPGDKIDLSAIDADSGCGDNHTFTLVTNEGFNAAGALRVSHETRDGEDFTVVEGNTNGGSDAEFKISVKGNHNLTADDFQL